MARAPGGHVRWCWVWSERSRCLHVVPSAAGAEGDVVTSEAKLDQDARSREEPRPGLTWIRGAPDRPAHCAFVGPSDGCSVIASPLSLSRRTRRRHRCDRRKRMLTAEVVEDCLRLGDDALLVGARRSASFMIPLPDRLPRSSPFQALDRLGHQISRARSASR